jgi:hypothetical protein
MRTFRTSRIIRSAPVGANERPQDVQHPNECYAFINIRNSPYRDTFSASILNILPWHEPYINMEEASDSKVRIDVYCTLRIFLTVEP